MATIKAIPTIEIFAAFEKWINQRPGLESGNYFSPHDRGEQLARGMASYRSELRGINKQKARALVALTEARKFAFDSAKMSDALKHSFSGRLEWVKDVKSLDKFGDVDTIAFLHYTTGQYWPTEYRLAAAVVLEAYVHSVRPKTLPKEGQKFETIGSIKAANFAAGGHWFDKENMSRGKCSVYPRVIQGNGVVLFVSSDMDYDSIERRYSVRSFDPSNACIGTCGEYQAYPTKADAYKAAEQFAKGGE